MAYDRKMRLIVFELGEELGSKKGIQTKQQ